MDKFLHKHELQQRVYYEDTDFSGAVYHAKYLHFLERGRTETIREMDIHQGDLFHSDAPESSISFVVSDLSIKFIKSANMDNMLTVVSYITEIKGARIFWLQEIFRNDQKIISADVCVACINGKGRPRRFSKDLFTT